MKRVKAACITQALLFLLKEDVGHDYVVEACNYLFDKGTLFIIKGVLMRPGLRIQQKMRRQWFVISRIWE